MRATGNPRAIMPGDGSRSKPGVTGNMLRQLTAVFLIGVLLPGCTADPPAARLQDYADCLFRTLGIASLPAPTPTYSRVPALGATVHRSIVAAGKGRIGSDPGRSACRQRGAAATCDLAGPVCRSAKDARASILDTVVGKYFVGSIQPWSVRIQARAYQLDAAREIEELLAGAEPEEFATWKEERDRLIERALQAPRNHVETLLPIMRQCGLAPEDRAIP